MKNLSLVEVRMLSVWYESLKGCSASESEDSEITFFFFSGGFMVSLVTVHLGVFHFFFFFTSVLGSVATVVEEGMAVTTFWVEPPPFEALTNFPPCAGRVGVEGAGWLDSWREVVTHTVK